MIKAINATGWALLVVGLLVAETASPAIIFALLATSAATFWLSNALFKEVLHHQYRVQGAPIATSVSRDLRIEI